MGVAGYVSVTAQEQDVPRASNSMKRSADCGREVSVAAAAAAAEGIGGSPSWLRGTEGARWSRGGNKGAGREVPLTKF